MTSMKVEQSTNCQSSTNARALFVERRRLRLRLTRRSMATTWPPPAQITYQLCRTPRDHRVPFVLRPLRFLQSLGRSSLLSVMGCPNMRLASPCRRGHPEQLLAWVKIRGKRRRSTVQAWRRCCRRHHALWFVRLELGLCPRVRFPGQRSSNDSHPQCPRHRHRTRHSGRLLARDHHPCQHERLADVTPHLLCAFHQDQVELERVEVRPRRRGLHREVHSSRVALVHVLTQCLALGQHPFVDEQAHEFRVPCASGFAAR
mmetsp:Transcript_37529/g.99757  ORF Transcript_37529/g.99757 Transcript_37529/m.99757 type:complete len:259 (+) Transcript_37529:562-1338(+)